MLDIAGSWSAAETEGRSDDTVGSDRGCQSEEYGSGDEGLGEHINKECIKVRRVAAGSEKDRDWEVYVLLERKRESSDGD